MHALFKALFVPILLLVVTVSAWAQPTISNITPAYGGGGLNSPSMITVTGTGFVDTVATPKAVRFVDAANNDVLQTVSCSSTTTCTIFGVRKYRVAAGSVQTIQVFALVNGVKSAGSFPFVYYGPPIVTSVVPSTGPYNSTTPYALNGGPWTTGGAFPGTTSVNLVSNVDTTCSSTSVCNLTAPAINADPSNPMGAYPIVITTPGGGLTAYFTYTVAPAAPTIASVSPLSGPSGGGNVVTVTGTNFIAGNTKFTFVSPFSSNLATGVSCTSTTCTMTAPANTPAGAGGPIDIRVVTTCPVSSALCGGTNVRVATSIPVTKTAAYSYAGIKLTPGNSGSPVTVSENGGTGTYSVALHSRPTANVHVTLAATPGGGVNLSTSALDFTPQNWAAPQFVTATGLDDAGASGNTGFNITHTATSSDPNYNGASASQPVTRFDNETKHVVISPETGLFTTRANGTGSFTIVLSQAPSATVTVKLASNDVSSGIPSQSTLTFDTSPSGPTSWSTPRTITVTGQPDGMPGIDRDYMILVVTQSSDPGYNNSGSVPDVFVTNVDAAVAPSGLTLVRTGTTTATATWNAVSGASYYNVKYSTTPGGAKTTVASTGLTSEPLTGLTAGQAYYFVVSTVNGGGESTNSSEQVFVISPPGPVGAFGSGDVKSEMTYYTAGGSWKILNSFGGYVSNSTVNLGGAGYTPVPGDYDGDLLQDVAVYNTTTGAWIILKSSSNFTTSINVSWGGTGYLPVPGDYDGDGKSDPAYYRQSTGQWGALLSSTNYTTALYVSWGGAGYTPVPGYDVDGDLKADITIYQQSTGYWYSLKSSGNYMTLFSKSWGGVGYTLVPGDYDGDHKLDLGLYQRSTGAWLILLSTTNYTTLLSQSWGGAGYLPVPGDYDGDGKLDLGVFQQSTGNWYAILSSTNFASSVSATAWGTSADRIISPAIFVGGDDASRASDFEADGRADITVYQSSTGNWATLTSSSNYLVGQYRSYGGAGYTAVPGDYDGDGKVDYGVYQNSTGNWSVLLSSSNFTVGLYKSAGGTGWIPVQGDYDGDGKTDPVVYNTTTGAWYGLKSSSNYTTTVAASYGGTGYTAVVGDFDGDGKTDIGYYQPSTGNWSVLTSSTNYTSGINKSVGGAGWIPVQADYDGDGKADFVVYNTTTGQWFGYKSGANYTTFFNVSWGGTGYTPIKGDYDGDGKTDLATYVVATGNWYVLLSGSNYTTSLGKSLGGSGYVALPQYP